MIAFADKIDVPLSSRHQHNEHECLKLRRRQAEKVTPRKEYAE
jgi:hypothetical protein